MAKRTRLAAGGVGAVAIVVGIVLAIITRPYTGDQFAAGATTHRYQPLGIVLIVIGGLLLVGALVVPILRRRPAPAPAVRLDIGDRAVPLVELADRACSVASTLRTVAQVLGAMGIVGGALLAVQTVPIDQVTTGTTRPDLAIGVAAAGGALVWMLTITALCYGLELLAGYVKFRATPPPEPVDVAS